MADKAHKVFVPRDTTARSMGADDVAAAIAAETVRRGESVTVVRNGSRGLYWLEPMIEIEAGGVRHAYGPVQSADVPALFDSGFLAGGEHGLGLGPTEEIPWLLTLLTPAAWIAGGWMVLRIADATSRAEFVKRFPEVVDQTVRLTRAGLPAVEAISIVAQEAQEPVRRLLRQISHELSSGLDPEVVLRGAAARVRIPEFTLFAAALCLQRTTGGAISAALANLSATLRARKELELKAHASTAQTRITLWVLSAVPVVVVAAQSYTNPGAVETLLETPTLLRWGVGLIVAGLVTARVIASRFAR